MPLSAEGGIRRRIPVAVECTLDVVSGWAVGREEFARVETILAVNLLRIKKKKKEEKRVDLSRIENIQE
jgi:hypothetical protein